MFRDGQNRLCPELGTRRGRTGREGGGQEVGVRLKEEKTLGEGQWKKALDWRDGLLPILLSVVSDIFQGVRIHSVLVTQKTNYSYCIKFHICSTGL